MRRAALSALCLVAFLFIPNESTGQSVTAEPFKKGRARFSFNGGFGTSGSNNYFILGLGAGYYLLEGLEAGVDGQAWLGSKPRFYEVTPGLRYVLTQMDQFKPYVGGFYRRRIYEDETDLNSVGGRAGLAIPLGPHAYLSGGGVYEHTFNCDSRIYSHCSRFYPEAAVSLSF
jgi:hypothetical protein